VGTNLLMEIGFWPTLAVYAIFVPWSRLVGMPRHERPEYRPGSPAYRISA